MEADKNYCSENKCVNYSLRLPVLVTSNHAPSIVCTSKKRIISYMELVVYIINAGVSVSVSGVSMPAYINTYDCQSSQHPHMTLSSSVAAFRIHLIL